MRISKSKCNLLLTRFVACYWLQIFPPFLLVARFRAVSRYGFVAFFSTLDTGCIFQLLLDHNGYLCLTVICQLDARAFFSILNENQFRN